MFRDNAGRQAGRQQHTRQHEVEHDADGPQVHDRRVRHAPQHLWRRVPQRPRHALHALARPRRLCEPEVDDCDCRQVAGAAQNQVFELEVAVGDAVGVHVRDGVEQPLRQALHANILLCV